MANLNRLEGKLEMVDLTKLRSDPEYQRELKGHHKWIRGRFDATVAGVLLVARRGSEGDYIIDGKQRTQAMLELGITRFRALVVESSGVEFEARLFREVNDKRGRKGLTAVDTFRAALKGGDATAVGVKALTEKNGFRLPMTSNRRQVWPNLGCVGLLCRIYDWPDVGPSILDRTLALVARTWPGVDEACNEGPIGAVAHLFRFREFDEKRLEQVLAKRHPQTIALSATGSHGGLTRHKAVADQMILLYNRHLRTNGMRLFVEDTTAKRGQPKSKKAEQTPPGSTDEATGSEDVA